MPEEWALNSSWATRLRPPRHKVLTFGPQDGNVNCALYARPRFPESGEMLAIEGVDSEGFTAGMARKDAKVIALRQRNQGGLP